MNPLATGAESDWEIKVSGNTKTQSRYIQSLVEKCLQDQKAEYIQDIDPTRLQECLINSRLFSEVDVKLEEDRINIYVKDRWSIIPIPFISSGKDQDTKAGFHVYESNLLGYGKTLGAGGTYSESGSSYLLMYHDRSFFLTDWSFGTVFSQSQNQIYHYSGEEKVDGLDESIRYFSLSGGYRFNRKFHLSLQYQNIDRSYDAFENYQTPKDNRSDYMGLSCRWDDSVFRFYYQEGVSGNFSLNRQIGTSLSENHDDTSTVDLNVGWQKPIFRNQVLQLRVQAGRLYHGDRSNALRMGGRIGFRGIQDQGAWVERYYAGSMDYQIPLHRSSMGTWTVAPFADAGSLVLITAPDDSLDYYSYGIGTYYFLKRIALPGLGVAIGHNSRYQDFFFQFTIGFTM